MSVPQRFAQLCMLSDAAFTDEDRIALFDIYNHYGQQAIYEYARKKKIVPYVAHRLAKANCDIAFWSEIHDGYVERSQKVILLLDRVFLELEKVGIHRVCVAENFAAILSSDSCIGCFASGDVDFYCDDVNVDKLNDVMESLGFVWSDRHKRKKSFAREYKSPDAIGEEFWLNFQWKPMTRKKTHLYDQRYILKRYHTLFDMTECYQDTHIKYFSPEAALYLNCVHIASGHYYILAPGLRLYADVDRPIRTKQINWDLLRSWMEEDRLGIRGDMVLFLCRHYLRTPVSDEAYSYLKERRGFKRLCNFLIDPKTDEFKFPNKGLPAYLSFLTKVELMSDGTSMFSALIKRMWVLVVDWS